MKNIILANNENCRKCMRCIRKCPTEAIAFIDDRIQINSEKCIHCDECINSCNTRSLSCKGSSLASLGDFDYTVMLVPTAILSDSGSLDKIQGIYAAIQKLGFNEVLDISDVTGGLYELSKKEAELNPNKLQIVTFCPTVRKLAALKYPVLLKSIMPFEYPVEIAAKRVRKRLEGKYQKVGIYSLCECVAKLALAKNPYDNKESNIDYAITIAELFPIINRNIDGSKLDCSFCKQGIQATVHDFYNLEMNEMGVLAVDGLNDVKDVLELAEFEDLGSIRLLSLFACTNGCIGGKYLWGNPYVGRLMIEKFLPIANKPPLKLDISEAYRANKAVVDESETNINIKEKVKHFMAINQILDQLPGYDCGACGFASCRVMAKQIEKNRASLLDCKVLRKE